MQQVIWVYIHQNITKARVKSKGNMLQLKRSPSIINNLPQHKNNRSMRKQSNKMSPKTLNSSKANLTGTEVEEISGKELKNKMIKIFEETKEEKKIYI